MSSSKNWADEERKQAITELGDWATAQAFERKSLSLQLGVTEAQAEALVLIREHGHGMARKVAKELALYGGESGSFHSEVFQAVNEYRRVLPWWRRLTGV
jgi:hypothetical protein